MSRSRGSSRGRGRGSYNNRGRRGRGNGRRGGRGRGGRGQGNTGRANLVTTETPAEAGQVVPVVTEPEEEEELVFDEEYLEGLGN